MKRLTKRDPFDGIVELTEEIGEPIAPYDEVIEALSKLAAYEDTGLEPEEVAYFLGTTMSVKDAKTQYSEYKKCYDEYTTWKRAEAEGRLVVLPCKVGDTVYEITPRNTINTIYVDRFEIRQGEIGAIMILTDGDRWSPYDHKINEIGKTVFLAREEAEAKWKERGE